MRYLGVVLLLFSLGCEDGSSPIQPTPSAPPAAPAGAPAPLVFSLAGSVSDTASRPLGGASVEVIDGPTAGTTATTDEAGRFSLPGTFTDRVTIRVSKDGYLPQTAAVPGFPRDRLGLLPPGEVRNFWLSLSLQPVGPSADLAGAYTLTLSADSACTSLPDEARTRTYTATIVPGHRSTNFVGRLSDARIVSSQFSPYFEIDVAGDFANLSIQFVERLDESGYLAIVGGAAAAAGPSGMTAPFNAYYVHCPNEPTWSPGEYWWCGADVQAIDCGSVNHQLTLVRR